MKKYNYSDKYKKGQYFTPEDLANKMIDAVPTELWGKKVFEPTCGDGNLVIALLNKMISLGFDADHAVSLIMANELDEEMARACEERVKMWMKEHECKTETFTVTTFDAVTHKFEGYEWVFANPPYGSYSGNNSNLSRFIIKNTAKDKPAVLLVKNTLRLNNVISLQKVNFPGISINTIIAVTYPDKGKSYYYMDEFKDIMDDTCKYECKKDEANYAAIGFTAHKNLLRIKKITETKAFHILPLKLSEEEAKYLIEHSDNSKREQEYMDMKTVHVIRNIKIIKHAINIRLCNK